MNNLQDKIDAVIEEMKLILKQYEAIKQIKVENKIEQERIVEQNLTIKHQIEELKSSQQKVDDKASDLNEREKQILIKEKSLIASNRLLDEKLLDFRQKTLELSQTDKKLQKDLEDFHARKKLVDQQALINAKMEETEVLRKNKLKLREEQVEQELDRLKNLAM